MVEQLILDNPIVSLFIILAPVIGVSWKVFHVLYVKPRDFKIASMRDDIESLKNEVLKIERSNKAIEPSEREETSLPDNFDREDSSNEVNEVVVSEPEVISSDIILNDLQYLLDAWNDKSLTDLQKSHLEEIYQGKEVVWDVEVKSVSENSNGDISATIISPKAEFGLDTAIAVFDKKYKEALLLIKKGDLVTINGKIERFFLSPVLENCTIVRK